MATTDTIRPSARSTRAEVRAKVTALLAAAVAYWDETEHNGSDPNMAGARLRLAAKDYARAAMTAGVLP